MSSGVIVAYVHPGSVSHTFMHSLVGVIAHDNRADRPSIAGTLPIRFRPIGICDARNQGAQTFLSVGAEGLWFVDTDMGFMPDTLDRLLSSADPLERPVMGALCFGVLEEEPDGMGGFTTRIVPSLFTWSKERKVFGEPDSAPSGVIRVDGTGTACLLVHRFALELVRDMHGPVWFDSIRDGSGEPIGEDLSFCLRLRELGIPVHVDTGIRTNHQKYQWISGG